MTKTIKCYVCKKDEWSPTVLNDWFKVEVEGYKNKKRFCPSCYVKKEIKEVQ